MQQVNNDLSNVLSSKTPQNIVLISLGTCISSEVSIKEVLEYFQKLGKTARNTDFKHTSSLKLKALNHTWSAALLLHTGLCQTRLTKKLKQLESNLNSIDLNIITFNKVIIEKSKVIESPTLLDHIKQLQPELFAWHRP
ncbi:hypothetical protein [Sphingobacterium paucimobilis]|uniref:Uncharacterized protein n=1 Tax=Sphingobacterium paucimobilis HER1398 TaxID=1346330 RepID=U2HV17_9SPHI|nr:hypothetical protein [Sphingobacterium paucimobilis]ERJ59377.1 hypothetical protein M472_11390 [Sphingobacterium paucimobilis HER1398]